MEFLKDDGFRKYLDVEIVEIKDGFASVRGKVRDEFLNFHKTAHGSYIISLADIAFAIAANSDGIKRFALSIKIDFIKPAYKGDELVAEARVIHKGKRISFYELSVKKNGDKIARGCAIAYRID